MPFFEHLNVSNECCISTCTICVSGSFPFLKTVLLESKSSKKRIDKKNPGQSRVLGTKYQDYMGRGIAEGQIVEAIVLCVASVVVYPALLQYHSSFILVNSKVTKYIGGNSYIPNLLDYAVIKSVP